MTIKKTITVELDDESIEIINKINEVTGADTSFIINRSITLSGLIARLPMDDQNIITGIIEKYASLIPIDHREKKH